MVVDLQVLNCSSPSFLLEQFFKKIRFFSDHCILSSKVLMPHCVYCEFETEWLRTHKTHGAGQ